MEDLLDFGTGLREAEQAKRLQKSQEEINKFLVDESLDGIDRIVYLLKRGSEPQRISVLQNISSILSYSVKSIDDSSIDGSSTTELNSILDRLLPRVISIIQSEPSVEQRAALVALRDIACSQLFPAVVVSTRMIPVFARLLVKDTPETVLNIVTESIIDLAKLHLLTREVAQTLVPSALTLGGVSYRSWQRVSCCKLLANLLLFSPLEPESAITRIIDPLLHFCRDNDSMVRVVMAGLLADLLTYSYVSPEGLSSRNNPLSPQLLSLFSSIHNRCLGDLIHLLSDDDVVVKSVAVETAVGIFRPLASNSESKQREIMLKLRQIWETVAILEPNSSNHLPLSRSPASMSSSSLPTATSLNIPAAIRTLTTGSGGLSAVEKADILRTTLAAHIGRILSALLLFTPELITSSSVSTSVSSAVSVGNTEDDSMAPVVNVNENATDSFSEISSPSVPRQRRFSRRFSLLDSALMANGIPAGISKSSSSSSFVPVSAVKSTTPSIIPNLSISGNNPPPTANMITQNAPTTQKASSITLIASLVGLFASLGNHRSETIRLLCARNLPAVFISIMAGVGPAPVPPKSHPDSRVPINIGSTTTSSSSTSSSSSGVSSTISKAAAGRRASQHGDSLNTSANPATRSASITGSIGSGGNSVPPFLNPSIVGLARDEGLIGDILFISLDQLISSASALATEDSLKLSAAAITTNSGGTVYTTAASSHVPAVGSAGKSTNLLFACLVRQSLIPLLHLLLRDPSVAIRCAVAGGLHQISASLGGNRSSRLLAPLFARALADQEPLVSRAALITSHLWLPTLACQDPVLRLQTGSLVLPELFLAFARPAVAPTYRTQAMFLIGLRSAILFFASPSLLEATLSVLHRAIVAGARPIRTVAVHTVVWIMRHGPTGRVRNQARDYIVNRFVSISGAREAVKAALINEDSTSTPMDQTAGLGSGSSAPSVSASGTTTISVGFASSKNPMIPVGNGVSLTADMVVDTLLQRNLVAQVSLPASNSGNTGSGSTVGSIASNSSSSTSSNINQVTTPGAGLLTGTMSSNNLLGFVNPSSTFGASSLASSTTGASSTNTITSTSSGTGAASNNGAASAGANALISLQQQVQYSIGLSQQLCLGYSPTSPGIFLGSAWRRCLCIEALGAAMWLFSQATIRQIFLAPVLSAAAEDPVDSVRIAALEVLPAVVAWFSGSGGADVRSKVADVVTFAGLSSSSRVKLVAEKVSKEIELLKSDSESSGSSSQNPLLRLLARHERNLLGPDTEVSSSRPSSTRTTREILLNSPSSSASPSNNGVQKRSQLDEGSIWKSSARTGITLPVEKDDLRGEAFAVLGQSPENSSRMRAALLVSPPLPNPFSHRPLSSVSGSSTPGGAVSEAGGPAASGNAELEFELSLTRTFDGLNALLNHSSFVRNPFRLSVTQPMGCVAEGALATYPFCLGGHANFSVPSSTSQSTSNLNGSSLKGLSSSGIVSLDDIAGYQTAVHVFSSSFQDYVTGFMNENKSVLTSEPQTSSSLTVDGCVEHILSSISSPFLVSSAFDAVSHSDHSTVFAYHVQSPVTTQNQSSLQNSWSPLTATAAARLNSDITNGRRAISLVESSHSADSGNNTTLAASASVASAATPTAGVPEDMDTWETTLPQIASLSKAYKVVETPLVVPLGILMCPAPLSVEDDMKSQYIEEQLLALSRLEEDLERKRVLDAPKPKRAGASSDDANSIPVGPIAVSSISPTGATALGTSSSTSSNHGASSSSNINITATSSHSQQSIASFSPALFPSYFVGALLAIAHKLIPSSSPFVVAPVPLAPVQCFYFQSSEALSNAVNATGMSLLAAQAGLPSVSPPSSSITGSGPGSGGVGIGSTTHSEMDVVVPSGFRILTTPLVALGHSFAATGNAHAPVSITALADGSSLSVFSNVVGGYSIAHATSSAHVASTNTQSSLSSGLNPVLAADLRVSVVKSRGAASMVGAMGTFSTYPSPSIVSFSSLLLVNHITPTLVNAFLQSLTILLLTEPTVLKSIQQGPTLPRFDASLLQNATKSPASITDGAAKAVSGATASLGRPLASSSSSKSVSTGTNVSVSIGATLASTPGTGGALLSRGLALPGSTVPGTQSGSSGVFGLKSMPNLLTQNKPGLSTLGGLSVNTVQPSGLAGGANRRGGLLSPGLSSIGSMSNISTQGVGLNISVPTPSVIPRPSLLTRPGSGGLLGVPSVTGTSNTPGSPSVIGISAEIVSEGGDSVVHHKLINVSSLSSSSSPGVYSPVVKPFDVEISSNVVNTANTPTTLHQLATNNLIRTPSPLVQSLPSIQPLVSLSSSTPPTVSLSSNPGLNGIPRSGGLALSQPPLNPMPVGVGATSAGTKGGIVGVGNATLVRVGSGAGFTPGASISLSPKPVVLSVTSTVSSAASVNTTSTIAHGSGARAVMALASQNTPVDAAESLNIKDSSLLNDEGVADISSREAAEVVNSEVPLDNKDSLITPSVSDSSRVLLSTGSEVVQNSTDSSSSSLTSSSFVISTEESVHNSDIGRIEAEASVPLAVQNVPTIPSVVSGVLKPKSTLLPSLPVSLAASTPLNTSASVVSVVSTSPPVLKAPVILQPILPKTNTLSPTSGIVGVGNSSVFTIPSNSSTTINSTNAAKVNSILSNIAGNPQKPSAFPPIEIINSSTSVAGDLGRKTPATLTPLLNTMSASLGSSKSSTLLKLPGGNASSNSSTISALTPSVSTTQLGGQNLTTSGNSLPLLKPTFKLQVPPPSKSVLSSTTTPASTQSSTQKAPLKTTLRF